MLASAQEAYRWCWTLRFLLRELGFQCPVKQTTTEGSDKKIIPCMGFRYDKELLSARTWASEAEE